MHTLLRFLTGLTLTVGITLTIANGMAFTHADLTGGGVLLHQAAGLAPVQSIPDASYMPSYELTTVADELVTGILLILLGFFLHAFLISQHKRYERAVPITVVPRKQEPTKKRAMYWMEVTV